MILLVIALLAAPAAAPDAATCGAKPFAFNTAPKKPATVAPKPKPVPPPKPAQGSTVSQKKAGAKAGKPGCDSITGK